MNDDQITALARELADELYNNDSSYRKILWWCEEPKERKSEELEYTLRFLLRRYALVERSKLEELEIAHRAKEHGAVWLNQWEAYTLFPEIAKEVENAQ